MKTKGIFFIFALMKLENYISDLLYRYECVIVPDFGGFVTNETSAKVNHSTHTFYPPTKQISFNCNLKNNDGLLANYIATVDKISYSAAMNFIAFEVERWTDKLILSQLDLENVGDLFFQHKAVQFEPTKSVNYLTSSFGLNSFSSPEIKRTAYLETVTNLNTVVAAVPSEEEKSKKTPVFIKYAAAIAVLFVAGSFVWNTYNQNQQQSQLLAAQKQQNEIENKIQQATFVIDNPLPTITLNVAKKTKNYHIVAGAFRERKNADKKVKELINKGFDAKIIGVNKWNLTQVAYVSYTNKYEALKNLNEIKQFVSPDAWLLVK